MADNENMVNEAEVEMITLEFDNDEKVECEILGVFEYDGQEYIALVPDDGSEDVYLYGYKETGEDEFELLDIEDDDLFEKVAETFNSIMDEDEDE